MNRSIAVGSLLTVLASLALLSLTPSAVSAHARVKSSSPAKGEVLATSPSQVSITFSNDIQKIAGSYGIDVTNDAGATVTSAPAVVKEDDRSVLSTSLQPNLPPGRYVVKYRNVSDTDGDPFEAGYAFYVGVQPTAEQAALDAQLEPPELSATRTFVARSGATATIAPSRTPAVAVTTTTSTSPPSNGSDGGSSNAAIIVIVAVIAAGAIVVGAFVVFRRRG